MKKEIKMKSKAKVIWFITKVIFFIVCFTAAIGFGTIQDTIITNEVAMLQMEHSVESFVVPQSYYVLRAIISNIFGIVSIATAGFIVKDIISIIKERKKNEENN